jgi:hypothetical protein
MNACLVQLKQLCVIHCVWCAGGGAKMRKDAGAALALSPPLTLARILLYRVASRPYRILPLTPMRDRQRLVSTQPSVAWELCTHAWPSLGAPGNFWLIAASAGVILALPITRDSAPSYARSMMVSNCTLSCTCKLTQASSAQPRSMPPHPWRRDVRCSCLPSRTTQKQLHIPTPVARGRLCAAATRT